MQTHWFSELGVLGGCPSGRCPKSWNARYQVQILCSSERSWELWVPYHLYVTALSLDFMGRVCLSLSYPFINRWCGYFFICLKCRSYVVRFWVLFRRNCSLCSCRFLVSVGEGEFTIFLCCHLVLKLFVFDFKNTLFFSISPVFQLSRHSVHVCLINKVPWWEQFNCMHFDT